MKNNLIRTRYAPSPTGLFHIGGARTALFNYMFAKAYGGVFVVRIEDTDTDRNVENGIESQLKNLAWLKIFPDESVNNPGLYGPYIQSKKINEYKDLANVLLFENKAYRCFCKSDDLKKHRENSLMHGKTPKYSGKCKHLDINEIQKNILEKKDFVIRLSIEDKDYEWNDLIKGHISIPSSALSDIVILKSNGYPTYNFAVVVDDHDMAITHVLRGEEHISNTPYQIAIKEALNLDSEIQYGHLPIIIDLDGKKLSKRNLELKQFIEDYKNMGFTAKSIVNYMCLLGWSPKDNEEYFTLPQAIKIFDLEGISSSPSTFDFKKMQWISKNYFQNMDEIEYLDFVVPFLNIDNEIFKKNEKFCLLLFKEQISYAKELNDLILNMLTIQKVSSSEIKKIISEYGEGMIKAINHFRLSLKKIEDWNLDVIKFVIQDCQYNSGFKSKEFFPCLRIASTTKYNGPELYKIIYVMGKENILKNLRNFLDIALPKRIKTMNISKND